MNVTFKEIQCLNTVMFLKFQAKYLRPWIEECDRSWLPYSGTLGGSYRMRTCWSAGGGIHPEIRALLHLIVALCDGNSRSAGAHVYTVRVTMAALLKVLTAVSRSTAAASLTQTPAVFSPAALRLHGNPQRNCKWTNFEWNWPALSSAWWARWCTRWRWGGGGSRTSMRLRG